MNSANFPDSVSYSSGAHIVALAPVYLDVVQKLFAPLPVERYEQMQRRLSELRAQYHAVARTG
jgi:hypothetical protein